MTTKQKKRRGEIIRQLSDLSNGGWAGARYEDYAPLEAELRKIEVFDWTDIAIGLKESGPR